MGDQLDPREPLPPELRRNLRILGDTLPTLEAPDFEPGRWHDSERRDDGVWTMLFDEALPVFVVACDRYAADPTAGWPAALRVKPVQDAQGVLEMTWSLKWPDGRATFEWIQIDGALGVRWRRIGDHSIFERP